MPTTLINSEQTWLIWGLILIVTAAALKLEQRYNWAQKLSAAVIGMLGAAILTNLRILPLESPVYDNIWTYVIPLSIPMLLFQSNLRRIFRESGRSLILFGIGALGTIVGAVAAHALLAGLIPNLREIAGMMTGSYIGGGVNFVALAQVFKLDKTLVSATTVADNFNMALYFIILVTIPRLGFFQKHFHHLPPVETAKKAEKAQAGLTPVDLAYLFAVSAAIVAVSNSAADYFAAVIPADNFCSNLVRQLLGNSYLIITTATMLLATAFPRFCERIKGADVVGNFLISIFFVVIGVPASLPLIIKTAPLLLLFCFIMVCCNMLFSFVGAKIFHFSLEEAIIASNANIGGPATASAMAISQGWNSLIGPGIFVGLFGYIIGNYLGTIVGNLL